MLFAQVPDGIKYQAVVRNQNGDPIVNRAMFLRISILEGSEQGAVVFQEIHPVQTNGFGLVNLTIGDGVSGNSLHNVSWSNGQSKWIRIEMDTTGNQYFTMGASQLLSVPYAFYAETSGNASSGESLWSVNGTEIFYNAGHVGVGTNNPDNSAALEIQTTTAGFLPPRMTTEQRDMISNPAVGLMIYNLNTHCLNVYKPGGWFELCGDCITPPQPLAQSNSPVCEGDTLKLFAINAGGASCQWVGPNGFVSNEENPVIFPALAQHAGTYTLSTSNSCGSTSPVQVNVLINPVPGEAGDISGTADVCAGSGPYTYSIADVGQATGYQWMAPTGYEIVLGQGSTTVQIQYAASAATGSITVTPYNACGNGLVSPAFSVTVNPLPDQAHAGIDQINIMGTSTQLQANTPANGNGLWTIYIGNGGSFVDNTDAQTQFSGSVGVTYTLIWTISNSCGSYSDTVLVSFSAAFSCGNALIDVRDGQSYATVQIGSQCWMAENLNYGTFTQGNVVATDNGVTEKYCYQNDVSNCVTYGGLYTWREMLDLPNTCENTSCAAMIVANHQGICPSGWHIPTDEEFKTLEMALGMSQADADLLNTWRGNPVGTMMLEGGSSGFEALLAGRMAGANSFALLNAYEYTHTCDELPPDYAYRRCLRTGDSTVGRWNTFPKSWSLSVRCVKNN